MFELHLGDLVMTNEEVADLHATLKEQRDKLAKVMVRPADTIAPDVTRRFNVLGRVMAPLAAHMRHVADVPARPTPLRRAVGAAL